MLTEFTDFFLINELLYHRKTYDIAENKKGVLLW